MNDMGAVVFYFTRHQIVLVGKYVNFDSKQEQAIVKQSFNSN